MSKKETPVSAKIIAGIAVAYALSPIDLIPDFIPVLGYLDDLLILPALIALTVKLIPEEIFETCRREADASKKGVPAKKWYFALPAVVFWIAIIFVVLKAILD